MAALLSSAIGDTDNVVKYINEARELGLEVLPPDVNESGYKFTVVGDQRIRFGLGAVRNVGRGAIESHHRGARARGRSRRCSTSCERIDLRLCNKRVFEALIAAGALRRARRPPRAAPRGARPALGEAQLLKQQEREAGQASLFGEARRRTPPRASADAARRRRRGPRPSGSRARRRSSASTSPATRWSPTATEVELFATRTTRDAGRSGASTR